MQHLLSVCLILLPMKCSNVNGQRSEDEVVRRVVSGLKALSQPVRELVIVTNNVFDDGITYDESTMAYIRRTGAHKY